MDREKKVTRAYQSAEVVSDPFKAEASVVAPGLAITNCGRMRGGVLFWSDDVYRTSARVLLLSG